MSSMFRFGFKDDISNWDVSKVASLQSTFYNAFAFNSDISKWDVSKVTNMENTFYQATAFDRDLSKWNVGNVVTMSTMFYKVPGFNADISDWDVSKVTSMYGMFREATSFNRDLSKWDVRKVTQMSNMFNSASAFSQSLCGHWKDARAAQTDMFTGSKGKIECPQSGSGGSCGSGAGGSGSGGSVRYNTVSTTCGCEKDSGVTRSGSWSSTKSKEDCQQKCTEQCGCVAVDYLDSNGWCNWYSEVCSKPQYDCGQGWSHYQKSARRSLRGTN